mmetsp:Transcript_53788/g.166657  ORF Transcript_53788/g.166657 Transcript_53788/m.166657 type:complete len:267 (-) Transcript_53788:302-1102(-)
MTRGRHTAAHAGARAGSERSAVWCLERPPPWLSKGVLASTGAPSHYFESPACFTRWLFRQPCGRDRPRHTLVLGWREAKPCMQAIDALRTGSVQGLRPDNRRNGLARTRVARGSAGVPVKRVVVVVELEQEQRAASWVEACSSSLELHVASNAEEFAEAMYPTEATAKGVPPPSGAPLVPPCWCPRPPPGLAPPDDQQDFMARLAACLRSLAIIKAGGLEDPDPCWAPALVVPSEHLVKAVGADDAHTVRRMPSSRLVEADVTLRL